jgi:hypothetical protein
MQSDPDELDAQAQAALVAARRISHGPERSEALKKAGRLRLVADAGRARTASVRKRFFPCQAPGIVGSGSVGLRQPGRLRIVPVRTHIPLMSNGTQVTVHFSCRCGMNYTATQERRREPTSGSFKCQYCQKPVYEWKDGFHYSGWKAPY